ncbi:MAG: magnesium transporter CorA family protein [Proteobacteria bacterium]|nr:magnesium transporter CorA family protein [Pseudomonadota bacterium]MBU1686904.1 magnesium transporter CorA family protein [Pseudomonadota bacterium]
MLTFIKHQAGQIFDVPVLEDGEIVRAVAPTAQEVEFLGKSLKIPEDFLVAALDRDERPRIETDDDCRLLIVRIPHHNAASDTPYLTIALAFILTPTHVVTVCSEESLLWNDFLSGKRRHRLPSPNERVAFLTFLFLHVARQYLISIRHIREEADAAEKAIHGSMKNEMLIRMLNLEKCLVFFTTSLRANEPLWDRFRKIHGRELTDEEKDLVEDVKIEFRQAQELADIYSNILSGMMDAFASIIANNLNVVMKLLTLITIILMLPTLIASIYGMNVELPWQHSPHAFLIPMVLSLVISAVGIFVFVKKRWF